MKKALITSILTLVTTVIYSQTISFEEISTASKKPKNNFVTYISQNGAKYEIGDTIIIDKPSANGKFAFIKGGGVVHSVTENAPSTISGRSVVIKKIWFAGTKKSGYQAVLKCSGLSDYLIYLEGAIETGEVKSFGMTSEQALEKLKKAKDKLDLEIITQEEYDKIKAELIKYIK